MFGSKNNMFSVDSFNLKEGGGGRGERVMWNSNSSNSGKRRQYNGGPIAVGVSGDKASQNALRWAIDNLVTPPSDGVVVKLIHVAQGSPCPIVSPVGHCGNLVGKPNYLLKRGQAFDPIEEILLPFRCYCTRKRVPFEIVILKDHDVAKALIDHISSRGIGNLILGASSRNGFSKRYGYHYQSISSFPFSALSHYICFVELMNFFLFLFGICRLFKTSDIPSSVQKLAPDFCNVFTISKGKICAVRAACRRVPALPTLPEESNYIAASSKSYDEVSVQEPDMDTGHSFVGSERRSTDSMLYSFYENFGQAESTQISSMSLKVDITESASESDFGSFDGLNTMHEMPSAEQHNGSGNPFLSQKVLEEMEEEMKSLRMELKQTIEMYHAAYKEALTAKQKATELQEGKMKEELRLEEALLTLEATTAALKNEKEKSKAAILAVEAAQRLVEEEVQKRVNADKMEENKVLDTFGQFFLALKYQSLFHIVVALILFYVYFSIF
ncbi:putative rossmann-like alpha/beta/alpha sandwich protein [Rosa chinensis]|uniref:RING-type E3 ubiquitin transferase n=1 Tax=Rosa chinensis TaxID=74649 RepID=A0A2P6QS44_ROSCH|nr:putative rossmann-like alpha/beta/alpha sandwich protein [Rosa chinensis]